MRSTRSGMSTVDHMPDPGPPGRRSEHERHDDRRGGRGDDYRERPVLEANQPGTYDPGGTGGNRSYPSHALAEGLPGSGHSTPPFRPDRLGALLATQRNSEEAGGSARNGRNRIWTDRATRDRPSRPADRVLREARIVQDRIARRLGIFVVGLLLAGSSRTGPRGGSRCSTIVPAIVTFLLERGRSFRRPRPNAA